MPALSLFDRLAERTDRTDRATAKGGSPRWCHGWRWPWWPSWPATRASPPAPSSAAPASTTLGQARVTTVEVVSGVTGGGRLRDVTRDHWGIENGLHHTGNETFGEDRCRVRRGNAPRVLASLRNAAVDLLRNTDHPSVPAATREMTAFPDRALDMLNAPPSISE